MRRWMTCTDTEAFEARRACDEGRAWTPPVSGVFSRYVVFEAAHGDTAEVDVIFLMERWGITAWSVTSRGFTPRSALWSTAETKSVLLEMNLLTRTCPVNNHLCPCLIHVGSWRCVKIWSEDQNRYILTLSIKLWINQPIVWNNSKFL